MGPNSRMARGRVSIQYLMSRTQLRNYQPCFHNISMGALAMGVSFTTAPGLTDWVGLAQAGTVDALVRHYIHDGIYI